MHVVQMRIQPEYYNFILNINTKSENPFINYVFILKIRIKRFKLNSSLCVCCIINSDCVTM